MSHVKGPTMEEQVIRHVERNRRENGGRYVSIVGVTSLNGDGPDRPYLEYTVIRHGARR